MNNNKYQEGDYVKLTRYRFKSDGAFADITTSMDRVFRVGEFGVQLYTAGFLRFHEYPMRWHIDKATDEEAMLWILNRE